MNLERYLKCKPYKDKLAEFTEGFAKHKQELRDLLQAQGALKLIDIHLDLQKMKGFYEKRTPKEKQTEEFVQQHGGVDAVLKVWTPQLHERI